MKYPRLPEKLNKSIKLTLKDERKIKLLIRQGKLKKDIAKKFHVSLYTIWRVMLSSARKKALYERQYQESKKRIYKLKYGQKKKKRQLKYFHRKAKLIPKIRLYSKAISKLRRKKQ